MGAYVSGAPWSWNQVNSLEAAINRHFAIVHWFIQWGNEGAPFSYSLPLLQATRQHGSLPMITWEPWAPPFDASHNAYPLKDIATGKFDAYVDGWAAGARDYGHPLLLRFGAEMNGDWRPWGRIPGQAPSDFIGAWQHLRDRFGAAGANNVKWVWSPDADPWGAWIPMGQYYPGDAYVDWLGIDVYNVGTTQPGGTFSSLAEILNRPGKPYDRLLALTASKPIMLGEWGSVDQGGDKGAWIQDAGRSIVETFTHIKAVVWFSEGVWALDSSPASIAGARATFGNPPFCRTFAF